MEILSELQPKQSVDYATFTEKLKVKQYFQQNCDFSQLVQFLMKEVDTDNTLFCSEHQQVFDIGRNFYLTPDSVEVKFTFTRDTDLMWIKKDIVQLDSKGFFLSGSDVFPITEIKLLDVPYNTEYWFPLVKNSLRTTELTVVFPKSVLSERFLQTKLMICSVKGILDTKPRRYIVTAPFFNVCPDGDVQINKFSMKEGQITLCGSLLDSTFLIEYGDLVTNIKACVVNCEGDTVEHMIAGVHVTAGKMLIIASVVRKEDNQTELEINQLLPGPRMACYNDLEISVKTFKDLEADQFVQVTYDCCIVSESGKFDKYIFGNNNQFIVGGGIVSSPYCGKSITEPHPISYETYDKFGACAKLLAHVKPPKELTKLEDLLKK